MNKDKNTLRSARRRRVRAKIFGTKDVPRLSVFRSNKELQVQLIDDAEGKTLVSVSTKAASEKSSKSDRAKEAGKLLAKKAKDKSISKVVFDRGGYKYHGRVKAVADGAREGGLKF